MLSRLAQQFADEIRNHDWSDSPYRGDRAGHQRTDDRKPAKQLEDTETNVVRMNVMWVTAQVLGYNDPNLDIVEYARACRVNAPEGILRNGLRRDGHRYCTPGTRNID